MSYLRVIPRDLFNEAKLLKCLGALYIAAERLPEGWVTLERGHDGAPFQIEQNKSDGSIFVANVHVYVNKIHVHVYTSLNSKAPYPLRFDHGNIYGEDVFADDTGSTLNEAFMNIVI